MAFITYVLLYGLGRGMATSTFTPDVLIQSVWRCMILQLIESAIIKFGINSLQVSIPFLDVQAYTGYRYIGLCVSTVSKVLGTYMNFLVAIYTSGMFAYFILKTLAAVVPPVSTSGPPRHITLLAFAAMEFIVMLILSWG